MSISALAVLAIAAATQPGDRTESPYFLLKSPGVEADALPLKDTRADVSIAGVVAHVHVTQLYANASRTPLEAIYIFPGSTRSAVFGMRMTIGARTVVAQIHKKEAARRMYEQAKSEGKNASLLEQQRPNVFQMNVANIMPGDTVRVELDYTELLIPENGVYEFVYPTVVGPRCAEGSRGTSGEHWTDNPYLAEGVRVPYVWDLAVHLSAGMGISKVLSPSHKVETKFLDASTAAIDVDEPTGGDRDFVLRYRLRGGEIQTGVMLYPGSDSGDENFFLMMMQPPDRVEPSTMPPREYIFVVDVSGSMAGFPLETAKRLVREIAKSLRSEDRFNLLLFAGSSTVMSPKSVPATDENIQRALSLLGSARAGGNTNLGPALRRALDIPRDGDMSTSILAITDGYVSVERELFDLVRNNLDRANVFTFGVGKAVNRHLIEGMARAGSGEPFVVLSANEVEDKATAFKRYVSAPVLAHMKLSFEGFEAYDVDPPKLPDLFADRPIVVFGKYRGSGSGRISIEGFNNSGAFTRSIAVDSATPDRRNSALRYLWARNRIAKLGDASLVGARVDRAEITRLGLNYGLMTEYTSFVAIDSLVRNESKGLASVEQALPAPNKGGGGRYAAQVDEKAKKSILSTLSTLPTLGDATRPDNRPSGGMDPQRAEKPKPRESAPQTTVPFTFGIVGDGESGSTRSTTARPATKPTTVVAAPTAQTSSKDEPAPAQKKSEEPKEEKREHRVSVKVVSVKGSLASDAVAQVVANAAKNLFVCYDGVGSVPKRVYVDLTIGTDGRVTSVHVASASVGERIASCFTSRLQRLSFEHPTDTTRVRILIEVD